MLLTSEERARFIAWLDQESASSEALAKQADRLQLPVSRAIRQEAAACAIISLRLKSVESQTIQK